MFKENYPDRINVAFYPYTYVRIMAMKGKLYRRQDYDKLLKMQGNEIAAYLEDSDYKEDIHLLGKELSGYTLVEAAIYANFVRRITKLQKISSVEMNYLVHAYIKRFDVYNVKTIIRAKNVGQDKQATAKLLLPLGILSQEKLLAFLDQDSIGDILKGVGFIPRAYADAVAYHKKEGSLLEVENFLDKEYYAFLFEFLGHLSSEHALFKHFLQLQIDVLNVQLLLRLRKTDMEYERLCSFFFFGGELFPYMKLRNLAKMNWKDMVKALHSTGIKKLVVEHEHELTDKNLRTFEAGLDVWLLQQSTLLLHQFPLSVDTLLGYMFAKEIEVRNLRTLVKGKQLGIAEEFLEKQLVIG
jgi:V/A-type H+/Na+-transporting ATPase subunit C